MIAARRFASLTGPPKRFAPLMPIAGRCEVAWPVRLGGAALTGIGEFDRQVANLMSKGYPEPRA